MFDSTPFHFGGSSNRNAKLWISEGKSVGLFGQEKRWNLRNPSTYSYPRNSWGHIRGERKEKKKKTSPKQSIFVDGQLLKLVEPLRSTEQEAIEKAKCDSSGEKTKSNKTEPKDQPQESQLPRIDQHPRISPSQVPSEEVAKSRLMTPQLSSIPAERKYESLFKHNLEEGLLKRIARRKLRRRVFGEINTKKVNQFGTACSPFHALATTEMQNLILPSDLPMTPRMKSKGIVCTSESDLKSLQLTFPELDEETAIGRKSSDRKKPLDHTKMPALPPLIKPSRSRLSENKKTSGCHLPTVPKVAASVSLKWGKYY